MIGEVFTVKQMLRLTLEALAEQLKENGEVAIVFIQDEVAVMRLGPNYPSVDNTVPFRGVKV